MGNYTVLENGIKYAEIDGTQGNYAIGKQNGEIFKKEIQENLKAIKSHFEKTIGKQASEDLYYRMVYEMNYLKDLEKHMPSLHEELMGIKDGSGISLEDVFLLNYIEEPRAIIASDQLDGRCTSGMIYGRKHHSNILFQNMDYARYFNDFQTLYKIQYADKEILLYGFVGQFGGIGINSHGLSVTVNTIINGRINIGSGIPSTAITRGFLEMDNVNSCQDWIQKIPASTANFYATVNDKKAVYYEMSANDIIIKDNLESCFMARANHAVNSNDVIERKWFRGKELLKDKEGQTIANTLERYNLINNILEDQAEDATETDIQNILSKKPILRSSEDSLTLQSMIAFCKRNESYLFVARGDDPLRKYVKMDFNE